MEDVKETFDTLAKEIDGRLYINKKLYEDHVAFVEGKKAGFEEGITQGITQGITSTALNMLNENLSIETISKVTGLTKEKILNIKDAN